MHYQLTSSSGCSQALHGTDAPHLVSHSSTDGHLGCLHFLAVMNNTIYDFCTSFCLNICLQFSWTALYLGEELLDARVGHDLVTKPPPLFHYKDV